MRLRVLLGCLGARRAAAAEAEEAERQRLHELEWRAEVGGGALFAALEEGVADAGVRGVLEGLADIDRQLRAIDLRLKTLGGAVEPPPASSPSHTRNVRSLRSNRDREAE